MNPQQIALVKESWQAVSLLDPEAVGKLFYEHLFLLNPSLKALFLSPQPEQSRKLMAMLGYVVLRLDRLNELLPDLQALARRHVRYGVEDDHYPQVGAALLSTLEQGLGSRWNKELASAWATCYSRLSAAMMNASAKAVYA